MSERHSTDPKQTQTAYQRWELASLRGKPAPQVQNVGPAFEAELEQLRLKAARDTQLAKESAQKEGYAAGVIEGRRDGYEEGYAQGQRQAETENEARLMEISATLTALSAQFNSELEQIREQVATDLLAVAQDMAQAMLRVALQIKPELLIPMLKEALEELPEVQRPASIRLHPEDVPQVKLACGKTLDAHGWRLVADPDIQRGGCRVQTASYEIDASLSTRWRHLQHALGQNRAWFVDEEK
jgi:flagellar assembly protein FliH